MKKYMIISLIGLTLLWNSCSIKENNKLTNSSLEEPITLTWYINFSWFDKEWGTDIVSQYITEQTGINVKYIAPTGDESQYLQNLMGDSQSLGIDLITIESWDTAYADFLEKEMLVSLDSLAKEYNLNFMEYTNEDTVQWYTYKEHLYVYPNASYSLDMEQSYSNQTFLVRKDIYEAIGSPDMSTPEGFLQALADAKEYAPLVNERELIPLGLQEFTPNGNIALEEYLQNFLAIPFEEEGEVIDRFLHNDNILWLRTLNEAYIKGLLAQDIFFDKRVQMEEKIAQGTYFAMLYQWSDCTEQLAQLYEVNPEQRYIAIDGPKNINGDNHTLAGSSVQGWTITGIVNTSRYQEEAMKLLTYLMSDEGQRLIFLGIEDIHYKIIDGEIELIDEDGSLQDNRVNGYSSTDILWPMMNNAYGEMMGYIVEDVSYIEEIKEWTKEYTHNFSLYAYSEMTHDLTLYAIKKIDQERKSELLVNLLLADTEEAFDLYLAEFIKERKEYHYELVLQEEQRQFEENQGRLK